MSYQIDADYTRTFLLPPAVEDWVPPDHPVRFVRAFVDQYLEGEDLFPSDSGTKGRPRYSEKLLLKIWIAAYLSGYRSCRRVEQLCREYLPFLWLTTGEKPDHNTLWRFWQDHRELIGKIFAGSVNMAMRVGLVEMALNAIDGTKMGAAGSTERVRGVADLEKKMDRLAERIRQIEAEIEQARASDPDGELERLSEELKDRTALQKRIREELEIVKKEGTRVHPGEPEARLMKKIGLGYNAQTVVDAKRSVIVAQAVVNDRNDEAQLVPMLDRVQETLGTIAQENLLDAGYNTFASVAGAEEKQYPVLLSPSANDPEQTTDDPFHTSHFEYDEQTDTLRCPQGETLTFRGTRYDSRRHTTIRSYRTPACRQCPVRDQCTRKRQGRTIELREGFLSTQRQRLKRLEPENQALLRKRMAIVERPFAVIKSILGFRRFRFRGLQGAGTEWAFMCATHNIKILMKALFRPGFA